MSALLQMLSNIQQERFGQGRESRGLAQSNKSLQLARDQFNRRLQMQQQALSAAKKTNAKTAENKGLGITYSLPDLLRSFM